MHGVLPLLTSICSWRDTYKNDFPLKGTLSYPDVLYIFHVRALWYINTYVTNYFATKVNTTIHISEFHLQGRTTQVVCIHPPRLYTTVCQ